MVSIDEFRMLALGFPEASESAHFDRQDFRVRGKIFATLGTPDTSSGTLKLTPEQQQQWMALDPGAFIPAAGAWGKRGWTHVELGRIVPEVLEETLAAAWENVAPKALTRGMHSGSAG